MEDGILAAFPLLPTLLPPSPFDSVPLPRSLFAYGLALQASPRLAGGFVAGLSRPPSGGTGRPVRWWWRVVVEPRLWGGETCLRCLGSWFCPVFLIFLLFVGGGHREQFEWAPPSSVLLVPLGLFLAIGNIEFLKLTTVTGVS